MAQIVELNGVRPTIGRDVYLAPTAVLRARYLASSTPGAASA
jgi:hypothetical protein